MKKQPLSQLGENALLSRLLACFPPPENSPQLLQGPGDDCAVVRRDEQWDTLLKTDAVVEGVHFVAGTEPSLIGRKALARAVSDIAAMGGIPEHALVTLFTSPQRDVQLLEGLYSGMAQLASRLDISLAGGETSSLPNDGLMLSIALFGRVEHGRALLRSGGKPRDVLCVSGPLGGSFASGRHLTFEPRVSLARELLLSSSPPHAAMDLSDGLSADLPRLAAASQCGFSIDVNLLPLQPDCSIQQALTDGEDYELLLALAPESAPQMCEQYGLVPIGRLTEETTDTLSGGWQHFTSTPSSQA